MPFLGDMPDATREAISPMKRMIFLALNSGVGVLPTVGGVVALEAMIRELYLATLQ